MLSIGMKIVHRAQPSWGIGEVLRVQEGGRFLEVRFAGRQGPPFLVSSKDPALQRYVYQPGQEVSFLDGSIGRIVQVAQVDEGGLHRYLVEPPSRTISELEIVPLPPRGGALGMLAGGNAAKASVFSLRDRAVRLDLERRADALGALFGSRVMPKPHQLAVVQRVLSAHSPRFVLADEVGLGKTIEAGMIYAALAQTGMAKRVLVVTPSHLSVQWLGELFHKFHSLFTYLDEERLEQEEAVHGVPAWWRYDKVVTSLELLASSEDHREAIADPVAKWDLVIFDEAHHLVSQEAFEAAEAAADNSHGLLLLTATPLQLDPAEYFRLLSLVDPVTPETYEEFEARLERQGDLSDRLRQLLAAQSPQAAAAHAEAISEMIPQDPLLWEGAEAIAAGEEGAREAFIRHMADAYSLSSRLIRNRRAIVGGLAPRRLVRHEVERTQEEAALHAQVWAAIRDGEITGTEQDIGTLLKRIDSSPRAAAAALAAVGQTALADEARTLEGTTRHAKSLAMVELLRQIRSHEPGAKVLVFTEARETLEYLRELLGRHGWESCAYHGELSQIDRDRQVARFRDPEGPAVLLSTEVGGEGRNFQFCHHLVNFDLAWSPAAVEQRIGRLDRIGQIHEVQVHCFRVEGTLGAKVFDLMANAVRVFEETVGGLDPVLELVESDVAKLASRGDLDAFDAYEGRLARGVAAAREEIRRAYDPLLDARSFDRGAIGELVERGSKRLGIDHVLSDDLEETLWGIARDLDERLEETVIDVARMVGLDVDCEEQVEAFQCSFRLGGSLAVDGLAGIDTSEERSWVGSFWRDTAVVEEENDYFATGHPLVEALFSWIRDGEEGRAAWLWSDEVRPAAIGFAFHFLVSFPEAEDLAVGAGVPSRQAARYLDRARYAVAVELARGGTPRVRRELLDSLEDPDGAPFPRSAVGAALSEAVAASHEVAREEALAQFQRERDLAIERLEADREAALARVELAALRGDELELRALRFEQEELEGFYARARRALEGAELVLDQAAGLLPR